MDIYTLRCDYCNKVIGTLSFDEPLIDDEVTLITEFATVKCTDCEQGFMVEKE